MEFNACICCI